MLKLLKNLNTRHHVQFNVVRGETLREAQRDPAAHRDLIVRVAGYSDYFCDLSAELQEEIIRRTEYEEFSEAEAAPRRQGGPPVRA